MHATAEARVRAGMEEAVLQGPGQAVERTEISVVALSFAGHRRVHGVVDVVVPLGVQAVPAAERGGDQARIVEVALGDQRQRTPQMCREPEGFGGQVLEYVGGGAIDECVDRIESQRVDVEVAEPAQRVVDDVAADLGGPGTVEVHGLTPTSRHPRTGRGGRSGPGSSRTGRGGCTPRPARHRGRASERRRRSVAARPVRRTVRGPHTRAHRRNPPAVGALNALTGMSSTKPIPRSTSSSRRSIAASRVPASVNVPMCNS